MTPSEYKYLSALDELYDGIRGVKLTDLANATGVTKVSAHNAAEKLEAAGLLNHAADGKIVITDKGRTAVREVRVAAGCLSDMLEKFCWIDADAAIIESVNAVCALTDRTRAVVAKTVAEYNKRKSDGE